MYSYNDIALFDNFKSVELDKIENILEQEGLEYYRFAVFNNVRTMNGYEVYVDFILPELRACIVLKSFYEDFIGSYKEVTEFLEGVDMEVLNLEKLDIKKVKRFINKIKKNEESRI
jgi:hypothetical protein